MPDAFNDILSTGSANVPDDRLLKYLNGELSKEEAHEVEKAMLDSDLVNDAVEGLGSIADKNRLKAIQKELEARLTHQLSQKHRVDKRWQMGNMNWVYLFIIIVLLLLLVSFALVSYFMDKS